MTPHEVIKDSLEKFEERFKDSFSGGDMNEWERAKPIIEYLKSSQLSLLLSVKEMVDKMVVNTPNEVALLNKELPTTLQTNYYNQAVGYVDAIEDLQSLLDSEINKIKEL